MFTQHQLRSFHKINLFKEKNYRTLMNQYILDHIYTSDSMPYWQKILLSHLEIKASP